MWNQSCNRQKTIFLRQLSARNCYLRATKWISPAITGRAFTVDPARNKYVDNISQRLADLNGESDRSYSFVVLNNDIHNSWALPGGKIWINRGLLVLLHYEA